MASGARLGSRQNQPDSPPVGYPEGIRKREVALALLLRSCHHREPRILAQCVHAVGDVQTFTAAPGRLGEARCDLGVELLPF